METTKIIHPPKLGTNIPETCATIQIVINVDFNINWWQTSGK